MARNQMPRNRHLNPYDDIDPREVRWAEEEDQAYDREAAGSQLGAYICRICMHTMPDLTSPYCSELCADIARDLGMESSVSGLGCE